MAKKKSQPSKEKAREMLHNPPHGKPLTDKQRKYFGYLASANIGMKIPNENHSNVSLPPNFNGLGNLTVGRHYSPSWGGQFQFGGNLPGAVGNMYARIGAPANGKYAKKTLPSANSGTEVSPYYIHGNDFITKGMQMGGYIGSDEIMLKNALLDERTRKRDSVSFTLNKTYPSDFNKVNTGMLNYFQTEPKEYKFLDINTLTPQRKTQLLKKKKGGVVKDNMGYWNPNNHGKVVQIDSPNITMQGVNQPLLGVSNSGHVQMMHPGNDYKFNGSSVTEYPIEEVTKGSKQDRGQKKKLTQLTDFSNNNNMEQAKDGKWIQKAINPKHKGYCTPMSKKTCTPKRKALAKTFKKHHGFHEDGGEIAQYGNYTPYQPNFNQYNATPVGQYTSAPYQPMNLGQQSNVSQYGNYMAPQLNTQPQQQSSGDSGGGMGGGMMGKMGQGMDVVGNVIKGIKMIGEEKKQRKQADQFRQVSNIVAQAASTRPEPIKRKYTRPEDITVNQNELFPTHGVGTNYLAAHGASIPGEIQNTYAPNNTLYSDLAYEPLNDSSQVKQFQYGGAAEFGNAGGFQLASQIGQSGGGALSGTQYGQPSGGSMTGSAIGGAVGSIFGPVGQMVGSTAGGLIGGAIDQNPRKIKKYMNEGYTNTQRAAAYEGTKNMQFQNSAFMEKGGYVNLSHDWNPQVITYFGDHKLKDLLKPDPMMNTLRAGGHISDLTYVPPSKSALQTYALGGELKVHDGGHAETISHNPYLPDGGETVMFRGKSHKNGGIPISYGKNPVEVEGGEPAMKLQDEGGDENLVVFGNMKIPSYGVTELEDKRAKGMKFKNYIDLLSKEETKHNKTVSKAIKMADETEPATSFDKLKLTTAQAMLQGSDMQLKKIAEKKKLASHIQNAILDTAEELGVESDELAKGNIKKSKMGGKFSYAQNGDYLPSFISRKEVPDYQKKGWMLEDERNRIYKDELAKKGSEEFDRAFGEARSKGKKTFDFKGKSFNTNLAGRQYLPIKDESNVSFDIPTPPQLPTPGIKGLPYVSPKQTDSPIVKSSNKFDYIGAATSLFPYFRPTNQIPLDSNQLMGEMYALSNNQLEPVQAQLYHPLLQQPYDISLQDQMNANQSTFNALERQTRYNPAAQSVLAGQKYAANSGVLGEQFRQNQAMKAGVYNQNRNVLNDATLKNLAILDQQYVRQSQAKSATKAVAQQALSSIADKIAKNKLENRTLGVYENLYGYRYDPLGRAYNLNQPAKFNVPSQSSPLTSTDNKGNDLLPIYTKKGEVSGYKVKEGKNGSIIKAFHGY